MNKIILGLSILFTGLSFGQSFTWVNGKTIETDLTANTTVQLKIEQLAIPGDSVTLGIEVVEKQIPNSWDGMLCVYGLCYGTIQNVGFTGEMSQIKNDTKGYVRLTVNPMNELVQGVYKVRVFDVDNPSDGDTAVWILNPTASIDESTLNSLNVYPNPAQENITIDSDGTVTSFDILDINGQVALKGSGVSYGINNVNVSGLPRGLYVVRLRDTQGNTSSRRISLI